MFFKSQDVKYIHHEWNTFNRSEFMVYFLLKDVLHGGLGSV